MNLFQRVNNIYFYKYYFLFVAEILKRVMMIFVLKSNVNDHLYTYHAYSDLEILSSAFLEIFFFSIISTPM